MVNAFRLEGHRLELTRLLEREKGEFRNRTFAQDLAEQGAVEREQVAL